MVYSDKKRNIAGIINRTEDVTTKRHVRIFGDGLNEVEAYLKGNPKKWREAQSKDNPASDYWDFNLGYEGAVKLARDGWPDGAAMIDTALKALIPTSGRDEGRWGYSQSGTSVALSRYLSGHPKNMRSCRKKEMGSSKVLHMVVNTVASCAVNAKQMANYGAALVGLIDRLEARGRRVHLDCVQVIRTNGNCRLAVGWNVKVASEQVDLSQVAFAIAHPAAFRRIGFAMMERSPSEMHTTGYGFCMDAKADDVPIYNDGTMIVDGVNHEPKRCNSPKDALRFAIEQVNKAAVLAGHASVESPLIDEDEWLAGLVD